MRKALRLTEAERELIFDMICIYQAGNGNEGDYQGWADEGKDSIATSIKRKLLDAKA